MTFFKGSRRHSLNAAFRFPCQQVCLPSICQSAPISKGLGKPLKATSQQLILIIAYVHSCWQASRFCFRHSVCQQQGACLLLKRLSYRAIFSSVAQSDVGVRGSGGCMTASSSVALCCHQLSLWGRCWRAAMPMMSRTSWPHCQTVVPSAQQP